MMVRACRRCGERSAVQTDDPNEARRVWDEQGWTHDEHGFALCPSCRDEIRRLIGLDAGPPPDRLPGQLELP